MNRPVEPDQSAGESVTMVMGPVALAVTNLERSLWFYENVLGCTLLSRNGNTVVLGSEKPLLLLTELRDAAPLSSYTTGLYHVALLLPGRVDLACALRHLLDSGYPVQNMEDHGISEALYLSDPDGNGIELYRDRPRSAWPWHKGKLEAIEPSTQLNSASLLAELDGIEYNWSGLPPSTHIGHIHLRVADLLQSVAFYRDVLGLDESIHGISGACFFATGGYHHHIACNVWTSRGAPVPPFAAPGLRFFILELPEQASLMRSVSRCKNAGTTVVQYGQSYLLRDPSGNGVILTAQQFYRDNILYLIEKGAFLMSTEQNRKLGARWAELWNSDKSLDVVDEIVDESFVSHSTPPGLPPGPEGVRIWANIFRKAFPDIQCTAEDVIVEGDRVVERFSASGTFLGEFMGIPPTGNKGGTTGINIFRVANGKIVEHWGNSDDLGMMQQMGVIPTMG